MRSTLAASIASVIVTLGTACGPGTNSSECSGILPGDLVITEVFADADGPDEGREWFEIFNNSDRAIELQGVTLVVSKVGGDDAKSHEMAAVTIAPGQYFTLGNAADELTPPYIDYGYAAELGEMGNSAGGRIALQCGSASIDEITYEMVKGGHSRQLTAALPPDYTQNDELTNWCEATQSEFSENSFGTPGTDNDCAPFVIGQCLDGGAMRDTVPPAVGDLVITEVMPSPDNAADEEAEWFEITAKAAFDLNGLGLDRAGDSSNPAIIEAPTCLRMEAGDYAVFAQNADMTMNGGLPDASVKGTFSFAMVAGSAASPGDVRVMSGENVIDAITWTSTRSGRSHALNPDFTTDTDNDQEANFCDGTVVFAAGTDRGTPNMANGTCTGGTQVGMCIDDISGLARPIVKPVADALVITEFLANPTGATEANREWVEIKNTGATVFDLYGLSIAHTDDATGKLLSPATCKSIAPGAYALIAKSNVPTTNGMLMEVDATWGTFGLTNTNAQTIEIRDGVTVLDAIGYTGSVDGVSRELSKTQTTTTGNDSETNFCAGAAPYGDGTNQGTPRAENACP